MELREDHPFQNLDQIGELTYSGCDIDGNSRPGQTFVYPFYICGHCSTTIVLREDRTRPRQRCLSCKKLICEKNEICRTHCTPLQELGIDHFEGRGDRVRYVSAVMSGATTLAEAEKFNDVNRLLLVK